jgi:pimeloyl-ACP methyl ester carboxylesterase
MQSCEKGFYSNLDAEKGKELVIFENSAHWPMIEEKEKYQDLLVNVILKESQNRSGLEHH